MAEKKEYRNAIRSRQMIRAAFVEMLHEKPFEKITATDIINCSGLNRSTFYAHYPDVKGIMDEFSGEIIKVFRQMLSEMNFSIFLTDPEPYLKTMISFLEENHELYRLLGQSDMASVYLDQLKKVLIQQVLDSPNLPVEAYSKTGSEIQMRLLLGGMIDIYRDWLNGEIHCTLEEMTAETAKAICSWVRK